LHPVFRAKKKNMHREETFRTNKKGNDIDGGKSTLRGVHGT